MHFFLACHAINFIAFKTSSLCSWTIHRNFYFLLQTETWISSRNHMLKWNLFLSPHIIDHEVRRQSPHSLLTNGPFQSLNIFSASCTTFSCCHSLLINFDKVLNECEEINLTKAITVISFCPETKKCKSQSCINLSSLILKTFSLFKIV